MTAPKRILHLHSSFDLGGKEARAARLMNAFGDAASHVILSAVPQAMGAKQAIAPEIDVAFPGDAAPALHGKPSPVRYLKLARYMQSFDLILSYNWGSMDGVMAHRMLSPVMKLPPLIHHEDGFNEDEREKRNWKRDGFRRLALPTAQHVMVPSETLREIARNGWHCPESQIVKYDNGIAIADYAAPAPPPPMAKSEGAIWVGSIAGLRAVKNLTSLVRAVALTGDDRLHLVIAGEGPERDTIMAEGQRCGMESRLHLIGFHPHPADIVPHFDIFALSSHSEQQPISLMEAMASALPAVCYDVGDIVHMVAPENRPYIVPPGDKEALAGAISTLAREPQKRHRAGIANRELAIARFDEQAMIARFAALYGAAMGDGDFAGHIGGNRLAKG